MSLAGNAVMFTESGEVVIRADLARRAEDEVTREFLFVTSKGKTGGLDRERYSRTATSVEE